MRTEFIKNTENRALAVLPDWQVKKERFLLLELSLHRTLQVLIQPSILFKVADTYFKVLYIEFRFVTVT